MDTLSAKIDGFKTLYLKLDAFWFGLHQSRWVVHMMRHAYLLHMAIGGVSSQSQSPPQLHPATQIVIVSHYINTSLSSATWFRDLLINLGKSYWEILNDHSPKPLQSCEQVLANITHLISRIPLVPLRWRGLGMREELKQNRPSAIHSCIPCLPESRLLSLHWLDNKPKLREIGAHNFL